MRKLLSWFQALQTKVAQAVPRISIEELSIMEQVRHLYQDEHQFDIFRDYRQTDGHGRMVSVAYKTIDDYIAQINHHSQIIRNAGHVLPAMCEFDLKGVPLNQFLLTSTGHYQKELALTLQLFRQAVITLCEEIDEAKHNEFDTKSYNLRLLNTLFVSLKDIGLTLHEVHSTFE